MDYTYIVSNGNAIKIGRSGSIEMRLRALQTHSPTPIQVVALLDGGHREKELHDLWKPYRCLGEWFQVPNHQSFFLWLVLKKGRFAPRTDVAYEIKERFIGDFAEDARDDQQFPVEENDYGKLKEYLNLRMHSPNPEAFVTLAKAYKEWRRLVFKETGFLHLTENTGWRTRRRKKQLGLGNLVTRLLLARVTLPLPFVTPISHGVVAGFSPPKLDLTLNA